MYTKCCRITLGHIAALLAASPPGTLCPMAHHIPNFPLVIFHRRHDGTAALHAVQPKFFFLSFFILLLFLLYSYILVCGSHLVLCWFFAGSLLVAKL